MDGPAAYDIEHITRYRYSLPVSGCVMSLCLQPRQDPSQRLLRFEIETDPPAPVNPESDSFGNTKHVLNIHREHRALAITARSTVERTPAAPIPDSLSAGAWEEIRPRRDSFTHWDFTHPSPLTRPSPALAAFVDRQGIERKAIRCMRCNGCRARSTRASTTSREARRRSRRSITSWKPAAEYVRTTRTP